MFNQGRNHDCHVGRFQIGITVKMVYSLYSVCPYINLIYTLEHYFLCDNDILTSDPDKRYSRIFLVVDSHT